MKITNWNKRKKKIMKWEKDEHNDKNIGLNKEEKIIRNKKKWLGLGRLKEKQSNKYLKRKRNIQNKGKMKKRHWKERDYDYGDEDVEN